MSSDIRQQIHDRMNHKETNELLELWQANDRFEWSDVAFDTIKEILQERGVDIPEQGEPVYEREEEVNEDHKFSKEELEIIDDENPPTFYDPFAVLLLTKQLNWMITAMIVFSVLYNIINFPNSANIVRSYFVLSAANPTLEFVISVFLAVANAGFSIIVIYFPLKALAHILRILMEMEFRSRKAG